MDENTAIRHRPKLASDGLRALAHGRDRRRKR